MTSVAGAEPVARAHPRSGRGRPVGGSERKQTAIRRAALQLFLREGFARTSMDAIAHEAKVSKRTIYNHYADKESLFLSVISDTFDSLLATVTDLMDTYLTDVPAGQLEQNIVAFASETALLAAQSSERSDLIRLIMTEAPHFPDLKLWELRPRGVTAGIATRLTRLAARGLLEVTDPEDAANHLFALTMGQVNNRSLYGAVNLPEEEITRMATSGARAFLRAYRPR